MLDYDKNLRGCPFCDGRAIHNNDSLIVFGQRIHTSVCYCTKCKAYGRAAFAPDFTQAVELASEYWNGRKREDELTRFRDDLKAVFDVKREVERWKKESRV